MTTFKIIAPLLFLFSISPLWCNHNDATSPKAKHASVSYIYKCEARIVDKALEIYVNPIEAGASLSEKDGSTRGIVEERNTHTYSKNYKYAHELNKIVLEHRAGRQVLWKIARSRLGVGFEHMISIEPHGKPEIISHFFGDAEDFIISYDKLMRYIDIDTDTMRIIKTKMELLDR